MNPQQIIVIHGGTTFADYQDYVGYLATKPLEISHFLHKPKWKDSLQQKLGDKYQVLLPTMPNTTNARYSEWKVWFDNLSAIITDDCILIGHSLGGIFLAKYLSENTFSRRIKATILVAAPHSDETTEDLTDFKLGGVLAGLAEQAGRLVFISGNDDPVIPLSELEKYKADTPLAEFRIVSAPDHFVRPEFPELVQLVNTL
jgi:predicted alpha/beta hydrolase family esterase